MFAAFGAVAWISAAAAPPSTSAERPATLAEEQKIVHALNRLGFGPRPGDVERVRRIGLDRYVW